MGIWAAKSAVLVAQSQKLDHAPTRLLLYMALMVLDQPDEDSGVQPRRFWAGREAMALGLGFNPNEASSVAAQSAVKRSLRPLTECGAVELLEAGRFHRRSEYHLRLRSDGCASGELAPALNDAATPSNPPPHVVAQRPPPAALRQPKTRLDRLAARHFPPPIAQSVLDADSA